MKDLAHFRRNLGDCAAILSPGMARVLERLVAAHLTGTVAAFTPSEHALLVAAAAALATVNRTPGAAQQIGRHAASAVADNLLSKDLLQIGRDVQKHFGIEASQLPRLPEGFSL